MPLARPNYNPQSALPDSAAASEDTPTASGAALTGNAPVSTTNSEIGTARRYTYSVRLSTRVTYDDNIFLSPTEKTADEFFVLSAGVVLGIGDPHAGSNFVRFEYSPDASFYVSNSGNNALQHTLGLSGLYQFSKLTVTGRFGLQILDGTDINTISAAGAQSTPSQYRCQWTHKTQHLQRFGKLPLRLVRQNLR